MMLSSCVRTNTLLTLFVLATSWFANGAAKKSSNASKSDDPFQGAQGFINSGTPSCASNGASRCIYLYNADFADFVAFTGNITCLGGLEPVMDKKFHVACQADRDEEVHVKFKCRSKNTLMDLVYPTEKSNKKPTLTTNGGKATALFSITEPAITALKTGAQTADSIDEDAYFSCAGNVL